MGKRTKYKVYYPDCPDDVSYYEVKCKKRGINLYYNYNTCSIGGAGECVAKIREYSDGLEVDITLEGRVYTLPLHQVEELVVLLQAWKDEAYGMIEAKIERDG